MSNAHRGTGSRSQWRTEADAQMGVDPRCYYLGILEGACIGPIERHHPVELADGGSRDWTVPACKGHHAEMTKKNAAARRSAPRKTTARPATPRTELEQDGGMPGWLRILAAAWLIALAPAFFRGDMHAAKTVSIAFVAILVVAFYLKATQARRAETVQRVRTITAKAMASDPGQVGQRARGRNAVARWGWHGIWRDRPIAGVIGYPVSVDDRAGSKVRQDVEAAFQQKLGADIRWTPEQDRFTWRVPGQVSTPPADTVHPPVQDTQPIPVLPDGAGSVLTDTLTRDLNKTFKTSGRDEPISVRITETDSQGPMTIVVKYPPGFADHNDDARTQLVDRVAAKAGQRWRDSWETQGGQVILSRRPPMPARVDNPAGTDGDDGPWHVLPFGVGEHGETVALDLKKNPHTLVAGPTRQGKTVTVRTLILRAARKGIDVVAVDPKQVEFDGYEDVPGVKVYADDEENITAIQTVHAAMKRRYSDKRNKRIPLDTHRPILLVVDEYQELLETSNMVWTQESLRNRGQHPVIGQVKSIARLGAAANIFLILLTQRPDNSWLDGILRDNLLNRLGVGTLTAEAARMLFGTGNVGRDVPEGLKGRINYRFGGGEAREAQGYWTPNPGAEDLTDADRDLLARIFHTEDQRRPWKSSVPSVESVPEPVEPEVLSFDDLAKLTSRGGTVHVLIDGEPVEVVSVEDSSQKGVVAEMVFRDEAGNLHMAGYTDEELFEVVPDAA